MPADGVYNVRIKDTFLGVEDHGLMVMSLFMAYDHMSEQGFQRIIGSRNEADSVDVLRSVLSALMVDSWEELKGTYCRVRVKDHLIDDVGHIIEDRWYSDGWKHHVGYDRVDDEQDTEE